MIFHIFYIRNQATNNVQFCIIYHLSLLYNLDQYRFNNTDQK